MGDWSLGSVHDAVLDLVENVPSNISGARLLELADQSRSFVEQWTGDGIGSNSIALKYQGPITNLTAGNTANLMQVLGADVSRIKLGDLDIKKGSDSNLKVVSQGFKNIGMTQLKELGRKAKFFKARG